MKNMREELGIITAYELMGTYRGTADLCGTKHKTVKRVLERQDAGATRPACPVRSANYEVVRGQVATVIAASKGRISAKRLLPKARAAGYAGSARNFRRLVAAEKKSWRAVNARVQRSAVWTPGEHLVIDWGVVDGVHVFTAVLAWSRFRFVRFAADEKATTTMAMLAECFESLGGVPKVVLADRMSCMKGGVVADRAVPTSEYVRFATHYRFRPDFCQGHDPQSKGIVEALVRYGKDDLLRPLLLEVDEVQHTDMAAAATAVLADLASANQHAAVWCAEVNTVVHSEIAAVPADQRSAAAERVAVAAAGDRPGPADPQGRQAAHDPARVGAVLRAPRPGGHAGRRRGRGRPADPPGPRHGAGPRRAPGCGPGRGIHPGLALWQRPPGHAATRDPSPHRRREDVLRVGPGRRGVHRRGRRGGAHPPGA